MPTKTKPKRRQAKAHALKKKAAKKTHVRIQGLCGNEPEPKPKKASIEMGPGHSVELTLYAGSALRAQISASYETAHAILQYLQGQVLPMVVGSTFTPLLDEVDDEMLWNLDIEGRGIDVNIRAHEDIALALFGGLREFLATHRRGSTPADAEVTGRAAVAGPSEPAAAPSAPAVPCPLDMIRGIPPQGVRMEDDEQGNLRIVKNEPTS